MINFNTSNITVSPSPFAISKQETNTSDEATRSPADEKEDVKNDSKQTSKYSKDPNLELTRAEVRELSNLKQRDREVRAHEQAHIIAGGQYVRGGAHYEYQKGPDGRSYAIGGEVQIDSSKIPGDPEATARKMAAIKRAAMAPAEPSGQDRSIASRASRIENQMTMEILMKLQEERTSTAKGSPHETPPKGSLIDIHQ
jgi:SprA-related family